MPPKKKLKLHGATVGQKTLTHFFNKPGDVDEGEVSAVSTKCDNANRSTCNVTDDVVSQLSPDITDCECENENLNNDFVSTDVTNCNNESNGASVSAINTCSTDCDNEKPKRRKIQDSWYKIWPLLYSVEGVLFCKYCAKSKKKNVFATGCKVYKTSSMSRHQSLDEHKAAVNEPDLSNEFQHAVENLHSAKDKAVLKCITTVLWLASENMPLAKFESMFKLFKELEVPDLEPLQVNDRMHYDSYYTSTEILNAISQVIDDDINDKINKSPFITILADESTDLANKKRITLNARIVDSTTSVAETIFLHNKEYQDGTGVGLATVILQELQTRHINIDKLIGFGSDGASVMSGDNKGVKGILMERQPHLIHIHCMAHRLALCTSQAADTVPAIKNYQRWLTNIYYYFCQSSSREQELHKIQQVLDSPALKYKEVHAVRWLSIYQAVEAIYRTIDPLISYLHQRVASKDPKSKGLLKQMASVDFIYITYLLMDTLAIVSKLCLIFQEADLDVATAKVAVDSCLSDLEAYKEERQLFPTHLEHYSEDITRNGNGQNIYKETGHHLSDTQTNLPGVKSNFINSLISNIKKRFPQKNLVDSFYVLSMRGIVLGSDAAAREYGNDEIDQILLHFGNEKSFKGTVSLPKINKSSVKAQWGRAKEIVRSMKYPVDKFAELWQLLTTFHHQELGQLIKLAQIALILPLHTADCERTFSQQNKILTKSRANLSSEHLDQLIRIRLFTKSGGLVNKDNVMKLWKRNKARKLYNKSK